MHNSRHNSQTGESLTRDSRDGHDGQALYRIGRLVSEFIRSRHSNSNDADTRVTFSSVLPRLRRRVAASFLLSVFVNLRKNKK
jgi:hypothetical protein